MHIIKRAALGAILSFAVIIGALLPTMARAQSVRWYTNVEEASSAALESNKPMMVDFWADWCEACEVMEKEVYNDPRFVNEAPRFLAVRIDFEKKQALARKYNVAALPTVIFTDSYGNELFRYRGFLDAKPLAELMRSLPADVSEFNRLNRILAEDKNNFAALESMGRNLRAAGLFLTSNEYYAKALQRNEAKTNPSQRESIMMQMGLNSLDMKDGKQAADIFEKCLKEFPASPNKTEWTFDLGRAYALAEKKDKARKVLEAFVREHPDSIDSEKAKAMLGSL